MKYAKMHVVFILSIVFGQLYGEDDAVVTTQDQVSDFAKYVLNNKQLVDVMARIIEPQHFLKNVPVVQPQNRVDVAFIAEALQDITKLEMSLMKIEHGKTLSDRDIPSITVTNALGRPYVSDVKLVPMIYSPAQRFYLMAQYMIGIKQHKNASLVHAMLVPTYPDQNTSDSFVQNVHDAMRVFYTYQSTINEIVAEMVEKMESKKIQIFKSGKLEDDLYDLFKSIEDSAYSFRKVYKQFQNDDQKSILKQYLKGAVQTLGFFVLDYQKQVHLVQQKNVHTMYRFMMSQSGNKLYQYVLYGLKALNNDGVQIRDYIGAYCIALYRHFNGEIATSQVSQDSAFVLDLKSCLQLVLLQLQMHRFDIVKDNSYANDRQFVQCNAYILALKELLDSPGKYNKFVDICQVAQGVVNETLTDLQDKLSLKKLNFEQTTLQFMATLHADFSDAKHINTLQTQLYRNSYMDPMALQSILYDFSQQGDAKVPAASVVVQPAQKAPVSMAENAPVVGAQKASGVLTKVELQQIETAVAQGTMTSQQAAQEIRQDVISRNVSENQSNESLQKVEPKIDNLVQNSSQMVLNDLDESFINNVYILAKSLVKDNVLNKDIVSTPQKLDELISKYSSMSLTKIQKSFVRGYLKALVLG